MDPEIAHAHAVYANVIADISASIEPQYRMEATDRLWDLAIVMTHTTKWSRLNSGRFNQT